MNLIAFIKAYPDEASCRAKFKEYRYHVGVVCPKCGSRIEFGQGLFFNAMEGNLRIPDEALARMQLRPRHHHAFEPLPRPKELPVFSIRKQHDEITVYVAKPEHDQPAATIAPAHYHGFALRYKKEGDESYQTVVSARLHHTLFFEQEDDGKRLFFSVAWVNPRLETGPWTVEASEIIG
jgi:hypothetical protein